MRFAKAADAVVGGVDGGQLLVGEVDELLRQALGDQLVLLLLEGSNMRSLLPLRQGYRKGYQLGKLGKQLGPVRRHAV